jgi:CheY-like chemotaxis protein
MDPEGVMHVLLVEKANEGAEALYLLLEAWGHEVVRATSGATALQLSTRRPFGVVILDLGLPDVPGETIVRALKAAPDPPDVIAYSGFHRRAPDALAAGCDDFIAKPQIDPLCSALAAIVARRRLADAG